MYIGSKIKKLRELRNFTQSYMANTLQVTQSTYCRYENDEIDISMPIVENIAAILTISKDAILHFDENKLFQYIEMMTECDKVHSIKERELYEALILSLKSENAHLQNWVNDLHKMLEIA